MIAMQGKTLHSQRLTYRLLGDRDKPALAVILSDEAVTKPAGFLPAGTQAEFDAFFEGLTRRSSALAILSGDTLIGYVHVNPYKTSAPELKGKDCVSTGFVIGRAYQRQGFGTEMLNAITGYLLTLKAACFADCFVGNEASQGLIEKCGYQFAEEYTMFFDRLGEEKTCRSYVHR